MTNPMQPLDPISPPDPVTPAATPSSPAGYAMVTPHGRGPAPYNIQQGNDEAAITAQFDAANGDAGAGVLIGVTGANDVSEAPLAAPNVNPYDAGASQKIYTGGDDNPAGLDDVAGSVAASVAAAEARFGTHQLDTYGQGGIIGDLMTFPGTTATGAPLDPGSAAGVTEPGGGFYEPPRNY